MLGLVGVDRAIVWRIARRCDAGAIIRWCCDVVLLMLWKSKDVVMP